MALLEFEHETDGFKMRWREVAGASPVPLPTQLHINDLVCCPAQCPLLGQAAAVTVKMVSPLQVSAE